MAEEQKEDLAEGTLLSHLIELRSRLFKIFGAVFLVFLALIPFSKTIFDLAAEPLISVIPEGELQALNPAERSVSDLTQATGLTQANASRHLQTLTDAGILKRRKQGLRVLYSIADRDIFKLCEHVCGNLEQRFKAHSQALAATPSRS